jgi:hypothetical protein
MVIGSWIASKARIFLTNGVPVRTAPRSCVINVNHRRLHLHGLEEVTDPVPLVDDDD